MTFHKSCFEQSKCERDIRKILKIIKLGKPEPIDEESSADFEMVEEIKAIVEKYPTFQKVDVAWVSSRCERDIQKIKIIIDEGYDSGEIIDEIFDIIHRFIDKI